MQFKSASSWWPLCLFALAGAAHADTDLGPYSFGVSEQVRHESNVTRAIESDRQADWVSTTELNAAVDQALGRNQFIANGAFDINRYKKRDDLNANEYHANTAFNWNTVNDLSGSIGGDSRRRQYFYGFEGDSAPSGASRSLVRNLQTDNHLFTNIQLGGVSRWTIFAGADANQRKYSNETFTALGERQWSAHGGTSYATSPDLSFGVTGSATHGVYPGFRLDPASDALHDSFDMKSVDLTTKWQASGVSRLDATLGYTRAEYALQPDSHYVNGSLDWTWNPPSHISVVLGLSRDSSTDTSTGSIAATNDLAGLSINNTAHLAVTYELTAKTSLVASTQFTQRRYSGAVLPDTNGAQTPGVSGTNRTWLVGLNAHFLPTRTTDVACGVSREVRTADSALEAITPAYSDNIVLCSAAIKFD